jgi:hypothetical protein
VQINSSPLNTAPLPEKQLRLPAAGSRNSAEPLSPSDTGAITRSVRQSSSRIQSVLLQRQSDNQRNSEILERNPRNRMALQSYFENGPTLEQQLDVELAGIDTYV